MTDPALRILSIHDDPQDLAETKAALLWGSMRRYKLYEAKTGEEGLNLLCRLMAAGAPPDCVILDFYLPDMDAFDFLAAMPREGGQAAVPVVVISNAPGERLSPALLRAGAHECVGKGWRTPDSLTCAVENACERRALYRELERRNTEARQSDEHLRSLLATGRFGMYECDLAPLRLVCSPEYKANLGLSAGAEVTTAMMMEQIIFPEDRERVQQVTARAIEQRGQFELEYRVLWPDGSWRWLLERGRVLCNASGEPVRLTGITLDITDRKEIEAEREALLDAERTARSEVERVGRIKDEFLATLSHELRTPVNAILGWSQVLRAKSADRDAVTRGLEVIVRNAKVQVDLIQDLLDMNRILSGKLRIEVAPFRLNEVIRAAMDTVRHAAVAKGVHLSGYLDPAVPVIEGDAGRLHQVLWNLLSNAVKFTPSGGQVGVRTSLDAAECVIEVADTGVGIGPEFLPHVFERFRQANGSANRKHGGLGLGLSIAKQLVEMHGGTLRAESEGLDKGTTFTIRLPLAHVAVTTSSTPPLEATLLGEGQGAEPESLACVAVMVVEDQEDALSFVERLLTEYGARVMVARSGGEALAKLKLERPHVLVSDVGMPGVDGYQLIREVRNVLGIAPNELPAIALTAFSRPEDRARALSAGYHVHLAKPVEPAALVSAIATLARG